MEGLGVLPSALLLKLHIWRWSLPDPGFCCAGRLGERCEFRGLWKPFFFKPSVQVQNSILLQETRQGLQALLPSLKLVNPQHTQP